MATKGAVLNRNESQSQLTANLSEQHQTASQQQNLSREVELRAQSNENSQILMESHFTGHNLKQGQFGMGEEGFIPGSYGAYDNANVLTQHTASKITVNLEDAVLEEQKLSQILEVSYLPLLTNCTYSMPSR